MLNIKKMVVLLDVYVCKKKKTQVSTHFSVLYRIPILIGSILGIMDFYWIFKIYSFTQVWSSIW